MKARPQPKSPFPALWVGLAAMAALTLVVLLLALGQWERPMVGLIVDPFGRVSSFGWPGWSGYQRGLSYPETVVSVDSQPLRAPAGAELDLYAAIADEKPGPPAEHRLVVVSQNHEFRFTQVKLEPLGRPAWLVLFGAYLLVAWLWLLAAGLSYAVRPEGRAVTVFVRCIVLCATVLLSLFDFHTTRRLVPLYLLAYALLPTAVIEFGLCFPERVRPLKRWPRLTYGLRAIELALAGLLVGGYFRGESYMLVADVVNAIAVTFLTVLLSLRCAQAEGRRRTQLAWGLSLLLPAYILVGVIVLLVPEPAGPYVFVIGIPVTALGALGTTYALVRFDLWDSRVLLRRGQLRPLLGVMLGILTGLAAVVTFVALESAGPKVQVAGIMVLALVAAPLHRWLTNWVDVKLFPADAAYKTTVEQLSLRFTDLGSHQAVVETVETTVRRVLRCERVRLIPVAQRDDESAAVGRLLPKAAQVMAAALASSQAGGPDPDPKLSPEPIGSSGVQASGALVSGIRNASPTERRNFRALRKAAQAAGLFGFGLEHAAALYRGELVYLSPNVTLTSSAPAMWTWLLIGARFREQVVGVLCVSPKAAAQLFTSEDEELLRTIANQAALALACAVASEQVEALRRAQEEAFRQQLGAAIGTLAAEIAHEIRFPINFFKMLIDRHRTALRESPPPLERLAAEQAEDLDIGREEVERLERMADHLRRIAQSRTLQRVPVPVRTLLEHTRLLLRDRLSTRLLEVDVLAVIEIDCDRDAVTQIFLNLLANALDACPSPGRVGVAASVDPDERLRLTVWDTGPGFAAEVGKLFQPWFTTKPNGSGLGLAITHRLVRAHGWELSAGRRGDRTCFDLLIPGRDWHRGTPPAETPDGSDEDEGEEELGAPVLLSGAAIGM